MDGPTPKIAALLPYPVYPAKMGGQKGIAFFYRYLLQQTPVALLSVKGQVPDDMAAPYFHGILSPSRLRYINPFLFIRIRKYLRENQIFTLIIEHPYYGWLAWMLKNWAGIQIVIHSHNIESVRFKTTGKWWWKIMRGYEGWAHRLADFSFFITAEDKAWAVANYRIKSSGCEVVPYGSEMANRPDKELKITARGRLCQLHGLTGSEKIFLFNGTLNYAPNLAALHFILQQLNPLLEKQGWDYRILICGKGLPTEMEELKAYRDRRVIYAGFVEDIDLYFLGSDIFLNPVFDGGGIKTKLVEALAANLTAVSSRNGSIGIPAEVAGKKMLVAEEETAESYLSAIQNVEPGIDTPASFFEFFYWGHIVAKAAGLLSKFVKK